jgi:hypothetical protein
MFITPNQIQIKQCYGGRTAFPHKILRIHQINKNSHRQAVSKPWLAYRTQKAKQRLTYIIRAAFEEQQSIRGFSEG